MTETSDTLPPPARKSRLALHLAIMLVIKVILLTLLWHVFIKPNKVVVDVDAMGSRIAGSASHPALQPRAIPPQGEKNDRLDGR